MINIDETVKILKSMDNVLILIHQFPDGDTIGSGYALCRALQKLGKHARVSCEHEINEKYDYIMNSVEKQEFEEQWIVAVDVADLKLLGGDAAKRYENKVELCIDHHETNTRYAHNSIIDPQAAAACELVYKIIRELDVLDSEIANALYTGIATDTGCFKFTNTTAESHSITAELIKLGADFGEINRIMFDTKSKSRIVLEKMALEGIRFSSNDRVAMITVTNDMRNTAGVSDEDINGISSLSRQIEGVKIGITLRERDKFLCKASVRTHEPYDAAEICAAFGGGGHIRAAGCEIKTDVAQAQKLLFEKADEYIARMNNEQQQQ